MVNEELYDGIMPRLGLSNEDVANVLTFVLNNFENNGGLVTPEDVERVRQQTSGTPE